MEGVEGNSMSAFLAHFPGDVPAGEFWVQTHAGQSQETDAPLLAQASRSVLGRSPKRAKLASVAECVGVAVSVLLEWASSPW